MMSVYQSFKMAWKSIVSNKMRSFLTMLGIIIGVLALVVLVSLVSSATSSVTDRISSLGSSMLTVTVSDDKGNPFKLSDVNALMDEDSIALTAPEGQTSVTGKYSYNSDSVQVYGTTAAYYDIEEMTLASGRFLKRSDVDNNSYVVVINETLATDLIGTTNCLGKKISLNGMKFTVVGLLAESDSLTASFLSDKMIAYVPYTTLIRLSSSTSSSISSFYVSAADEDDMDATETVLTNLLLERFANDEDAFSISDTSALADTMSSVTNIMSLMLGGIAAISLLVGGIGIMNIMMVSVTERTREIGIRKAIGAGRGVILLQFLIEALLLSLMGCFLGILVSWGIIQIINLVSSDTTYQMSIGAMWVAIIFSTVIGVIFGLYPAQKAAKKRPIEALHYEG